MSLMVWVVLDGQINRLPLRTINLAELADPSGDLSGMIFIALFIAVSSLEEKLDWMIGVPGFANFISRCFGPFFAFLIG